MSLERPMDNPESNPPNPAEHTNPQENVGREESETFENIDAFGSLNSRVDQLYQQHTSTPEYRNRMSEMTAEQQMQADIALRQQIQQQAQSEIQLRLTEAFRRQQQASALAQSFTRSISSEATKSAEEMREGEWERFTIVSEVGYPRDIYLPRDDEAKIAEMRELLNKIESSLAPEGDQSNRRRLNEFILVLPLMQSLKVEEKIRLPGLGEKTVSIGSGTTEVVPKFKPGERSGPDGEPIQNEESDDEYDERRYRLKHLGDAMYREFYRRLHFHQAYVQFYQAKDTQGIVGAIGSQYNDQLNFLMVDAPDAYKFSYKDSEGNKKNYDLTNNSPLLVFHFYQALERHAGDFIKKDNSAKEKMREEIENEVFANWEKGRPDKDLSDKEKSRHAFYMKAALESAMRIAERKWEMDFRKYYHEKLVGVDEKGVTRIFDPNDPKAEEEMIKFLNTGRSLDWYGVEMEGTGSYTARNLNIKARLGYRAGHSKYRMYYELVKGVDFNNRDFFSLLPEDLYKSLSKRFAVAGKKNPAEMAANYTYAIFGVKGRMDGGDYKWPSGISLSLQNTIFRIEDLNSLNISPDDLKERKSFIEEVIEDSSINSAFKSDDGRIRLFDFKLIEGPSFKLAPRVLIPDQIRSQAESGEGYLANPSEEGMVKFGGLFFNQGAGQFSNIRNMLVNLAGFEQTHEGQHVMHIARPSMSSLDLMVAQRGRQMRLDETEIRNAWDKVIENKGFESLIALDILATRLNLRGVLFELIWAMIRSSMGSAPAARHH